MANTVTAPPEGSDPKSGHPAARRPGLWKGRTAILIGLVLLGIGLRHAFTGLSQLLSDVREAMGIGTAGATFIGTLPILCFGAAGFLAPVVVRNIGAESTAFLAVALAAAGTLARPFVDSPAVFMVLSIVALTGMGQGRQ